MAKMMRSRLTGEYKLYVLSDEYVACTRFEADMGALKVKIQQEFDAQEIDAQVETCKRIRERFYDYILLETWVPYESPLPPFVWVAIVAVITSVAITVTVVVSSWAIRNYILGPFPKYVCDICGEEFDTLPALIAHRRMAHPDVKPYQCPYCGMAFDTAEELEAHMQECRAKVPEVPEWVPWLIGGLAIIGAIVVIPPLTEMVRGK